MYAMVATRANIAFVTNTNHVEGWSTALDSYKTHHKVFEEHLGLQIMP